VSVAVALRWVLRELRGARRRLLLFVLCLSVGVAAVTAVSGLASGVDGALRGRARELLAADVAVEARRPLPAALETAASGLRVQRTDVLETTTVVAVPPRGGAAGPSRLAEVKVVGPGYPWYGAVRVSPPRGLQGLLGPERAVVAPEILTGLRLRVGERLRVGGADFVVAGTVLEEPDRRSFSLSLAPRVFLSPEGLARARLLALGSRVTHRALFRLPQGSGPAAATRLATALRKAAGPLFEVETYVEAQPAVREGLRRAERFLGLVALLSLLVGGVGVSQTVRAWLAGRLDAIAVLRSLGLSGGEAVVLHLVQVAVLAGAGCAVGALCGIGVQAVAPLLLGDLLPAGAVRLWQPAAVGRGVGLGLAVSALFCLGPLAAVRRVPPVRVLRREAEPLPAPRGTGALTLAALLCGALVVAWVQGTSWRLAGAFVGVVLVASLALAGAARVLVWGAVRLPLARARLTVRQGLLALARPGAGTLGAMVALGLGVLVVFTMTVVQDQLARGLERDLPGSSPTAFLADVQPDQVQGLRGLLAREGARDVRTVPFVVARLRAVDGRAVEDLARGKAKEGRDSWALAREQRLSFQAALPASNRLVAGRWWSGRPGDEVSVEEEFARSMGARIGSHLEFDVQGVPVTLRVTSLRHVEWRTFDINFFLLVEPGRLEQAPHVFVATARFPAGAEQRIQDQVVARYANVTVVRVGEVLEKVAGVIRRIGLAVRVLGGFTAVAGLAILAGSIGATAARRGREVALLKTLGMTRGGVVAAYAVEYGVLGMVAGLLGGAFGTLLSWVVLTRLLDLGFTPPLGTLLAAVLAGTLLTVASGLAASVPALAMRPMEVLRAE
jgi:putative ABC transport system permease protein